VEAVMIRCEHVHRAISQPVPARERMFWGQ
jgi:hypothetical protein